MPTMLPTPTGNITAAATATDSMSVPKADLVILSASIIIYYQC